ncbi:cysteine synthase A [Lachnospiraceae bacterium 62-26]
MADYKKGILDLIGNTPLIEVKNIEKELELNATVLVKLEYLNPAGSAKDRVAKAMIEDAEMRGILREGAVIIEPTSGNTGIGLASIAAVKGYRLILTMPDTMSVERRNILKAYGAELVLTEGAQGMEGAIRKAEELAEEIPGSFIPGQFVNPANPAVHRATTGPEIFRDTDGKVDIFIAGVGTGGTITGIGEYLKEQNPGIKVVALEPADSPVLSEGRAGAHGIQGIGAGFVPDILNTEIYDEIFKARSEDAYAAAKLLAKKEGILAGISSGAALHGAIELAKRPENKGKVIVALLPDSGDRYYSTPLFIE